MRLRYFIFFAFIIFSLASCDEKRVFEENIDMPENDWYADSAVQFSFEIPDNAINYNVLANVRNAISYPFANLYITYYLHDSTGKVLTQKLMRLPLFDKKTGKPHGEGLGDIFDHRFSILENYKFPQKGKYKLVIKQYMRQNPLPFIMSVGIRVEK